MTEQLSGQEKRMTFRLLSYWQRARGEKEMPSLAEVNISEIEEVWHYTFTLALGVDEADHHFQYFGPELASTFGRDYTGMTLEESLSDIMINNTIGYYDEVLETRRPTSQSSEFFMNGQEIRYRSIILPLSSNGETIDYMFGTTNYRIF